jgi:murein peptide amidase A
MVGALLLAAVMMSAPFRAPFAPANPGLVVDGQVPASQLVGRSVEGRAIRATRIGDGPRAMVIVGCVHGDECAGRSVIRRLRAATPPAGVTLWLVELANPDGTTADTRQNAHGVDLNRNFPYRWRRLPRGTFYSGPRPLSEPESRALYAFLRRTRPVISIWYHQHADLVDESGGDVAVERRYARLVGMPLRRFGRPPGSITSWQNATYRDDTAFVVELPAGRLGSTAAARHARAVLTLAREAS